MTVVRQLERVVARLKGDPAYRFEVELSTGEAIAVAAPRSLQVLRGLLLRLRAGSANGLTFVGRGVTIRRASGLVLGRSVILEDGVNIDAMSQKGVVLGDNVTIKNGTIVVCTAVIRQKGVGLRIGNNSSVGALSFLGAQGGITIGEDVLIGPGVKIFSEDHRFADPEIPIRLQGETRAEVRIGDNCWIGAGAIIVRGVTIGRGSVVAAGSVVTQDIEMDSLAAGIPARRIRSRLESEK
jgi:acetyltransferase-like isoleucine patch superfamily enzyme